MYAFDDGLHVHSTPSSRACPDYNLSALWNDESFLLIQQWPEDVRDRIAGMMEAPAYFDHSATTPVDARVLEAMTPYFKQAFGNPSSVHRWGQEAEAALTSARELVARLLACDPASITFTSGASESNNLALAGLALKRKRGGADGLLSTPVEHPSVLRTLSWLEGEHGFNLKLLPVDANGLIDPSDLEHELSERTALASIIYANNEVGSIHPIPELTAICHEAGVPIHSDATQATNYLPLSIPELQVDLLSLGAHKFYGPKGIGLLYSRPGLELEPLLHGGSQEHGLRPGTENLALIVGLAEALKIALAERESETARLKTLRDRIIYMVGNEIPLSRLTGHPTQRLPHHASFAFQGLESNALLAALDVQGFACSAGSACKVGDPEPSRVLTAMGLDRSWSLGSLRVSLGRGTSESQVDRFCQVLPPTVERMRSASPKLKPS
jgi:cysteine desulfurase